MRHRLNPSARILILCYCAAILLTAAWLQHRHNVKVRAAEAWHVQNCAAAHHGFDPNYSASHVAEACHD